MYRRLTVLAATIVVAPLAATQEAPAARRAAAAVPLFATHEPLRLTIRAPLKRIMADRSQDSEEFPATVWVHGAGDGESVPAEIRTRGRTRLRRRICEFPPLRLDFPRESVAGTVFEGQDKLKLVTHCRGDREEYGRYLLLEYLAYRTYQVLTDASFRVRLAEITYRDTGTDDGPATHPGVLIEDDDMMAARLGWESLRLPALPLPAVDTAHLALVEVFQYFMGNTDFSAFIPDPGDDECCHNVQLVGRPSGPILPVPYDFDLSGVVNTSYANRLYRSNLRTLGIPSVRVRAYRGWCGSRAYVPAALQRLRDRRAQIYELYRSQRGLDRRVIAETLAYFDEFYATIDDERATAREIYDACRLLGGEV